MMSRLADWLRSYFGTAPEPVKEPSWKRNFALSPEADAAARKKGWETRRRKALNKEASK